MNPELAVFLPFGVVLLVIALVCFGDWLADVIHAHRICNEVIALLNAEAGRLERLTAARERRQQMRVCPPPTKPARKVASA